MQPIALQLYTLREALHADFEGTVRRVAEIGYAGVEPFGNPGNLLAAAALYKDLGLAVPSAHVALPLDENQAITLNVAAAYDLARIILPATDRWTTADEAQRSCARYNAASRIAAENGLALGIHNHWWEFARLDDGRTGYEIMHAELDPDIFFEVDIYWVQTGGLDPADFVRDLGARAPLLHVKDGPADTPEHAMVAVGDGAVDIPGVIQAGAGSTEWLVVELDRCDSDMLAAVERSFNYLVSEGLGHGRTDA